MKLCDVDLAISDSVWGYSAPVQRVLNTDWQETTTITRIAASLYTVSCGGGPDGTGWQATAYSMAQAVKFSGFAPASLVDGAKIKTVFDA